MRFCYWLVACLLCPLLRAQAEVRVASEFPFEFREGLLWVKASVPRTEEDLNLLLDTGASVSVLDAATARRLNLKFGRPVNVRGVHTTLIGNWLSPISIQANRTPLPATYLAVDLHQFGKSCRQPVDGLLGADFFRGRIVQIDFDARKLRILADTPDHRNADTIRLQLGPCGMRLPIAVNGCKPQWVRLDTGCASALQWVTSEVRPQDCSRRPAVGLTELSIPQTQTTVRIGPRQFQNVPTGVHEEPIFQGESGLLGNALLSRFASISIDAKSGRLFLEPRPPAGP